MITLFQLEKMNVVSRCFIVWLRTLCTIKEIKHNFNKYGRFQVLKPLWCFKQKTALSNLIDMEAIWAREVGEPKNLVLHSAEGGGKVQGSGGGASQCRVPPPPLPWWRWSCRAWWSISRTFRLKQALFHAGQAPPEKLSAMASYYCRALAEC